MKPVLHTKFMKQKKLILMVIVFSLVLIGGFYFISNTNSTPEAKPEKAVPEMTYSLETISAHNSKSDCWQAINDVVYDFTPYLMSDDHPGGAAMAKDCGTDATFTYENDPEHSDYAKSLLSEYVIGMLE